LAKHGVNIIIADLREEPREGVVPSYEQVARTTAVDAKFVNSDVTR
jgi:hypothetical protein